MAEAMTDERLAEIEKKVAWSDAYMRRALSPKTYAESMDAVLHELLAEIYRLRASVTG